MSQIARKLSAEHAPDRNTERQPMTPMAGLVTASERRDGPDSTGRASGVLGECHVVGGCPNPQRHGLQYDPLGIDLSSWIHSRAQIMVFIESCDMTISWPARRSLF